MICQDTYRAMMERLDTAPVAYRKHTTKQINLVLSNENRTPCPAPRVVKARARQARILKLVGRGARTTQEIFAAFESEWEDEEQPTHRDARTLVNQGRLVRIEPGVFCLPEEKS